MFCIIPANRACLTNFITISPTQFACSFPSSPHFSHLVVFILPGNTVPPGTAAGVHVQLPGSTEFRFLGAIANEKPSAIFKVNLPASKLPDGAFDRVADAMPEPYVGDINLGISIEPVASIQVQLAALHSSQPSNPPPSTSAMVPYQTLPSTKLLAQRIIKNAFNFLASFSGGQDGQEVVPLKSFQDWWARFERRVENDPGFLERDEGA